MQGGGRRGQGIDRVLESHPVDALQHRENEAVRMAAASPARAGIVDPRAGRSARNRPRIPTMMTMPAANCPRCTAIQLSEAAYSAKTA